LKTEGAVNEEAKQLLLIDVPAIIHPPGESDEFYTPRHLFAKWHAETPFTIDVAATAESACLPRFWTIHDDALKQSWAGEHFWCNPPFSRLSEFVEKAHCEVLGNGCMGGRMLMPANRTEQPFWQEFIEPYRDGGGDDELRFALLTQFLPKRFQFGFPGDPTGESGDSPKFGCVLVTWVATE